MMYKKHAFFALFFTFALGIFSVQTSFAQEETIQKPVVVAFFADWCGSCKLLEPKLEKAKRTDAAKSLEFIKFDMTNDQTRRQTEVMAKEKGLVKLLETYGFGTGFVVIFDPNTQSVMETIISSHSPEQIASMFEKAAKG